MTKKRSAKGVLAKAVRYTVFTTNSPCGIPTLMFFRGGKLVDKLTGLVPRSTIEDAIMKCLSGQSLMK